MSSFSTFAVPAAYLAGAHLAKVTSVQDPERIGRIQVQIMTMDPDGSALVWARVAVAFAGNNYGAFLIPSTGEEVLVVFTGNDVRFPVVIGALWHGGHSLPEDVVSDAITSWTITGRNGTRVAIIEDSTGAEAVEIETPMGASAIITDANGGEITLTVGSNSITMGTAGIAVETAGEFSVDAATISLTAGSVAVTAGSSDFSGSISCASITTPSVIAASYTPGAGNIW
jgi:uncharacterized protein involved in type VI secretion and phage assembly